MAQRSGTESFLVWYDQPTEDTDPVTEGYVFPLSAAESYEPAARPLLEVPLWRGNPSEVHAALQGTFNAAGDVPVNLDARFAGRWLKTTLGVGAYSKTAFGAAADARYRHRFGLSAARFATLEKVSSETPALFHRASNVKINSFSLAGAQQGPAVASLNWMGKGDEVFTQIDATPTRDSFQALSYLDGQIIKGSTVLARVVSSYDFIFNRNLQPTDAFFSAKKAGIPSGQASISGNLGLIFENYDFYNEALNANQLYQEVIYANAPMDSTPGPDMWFRCIKPLTLFGKSSWKAGGAAGILVTQPYRVVPIPTPGGVAGEVMSSRGPFTITGPNVDLGIKVNGGGTITKTLTTGTRTAAQIDTDIGAVTGGYADVFANRVRIGTSTLGSTGSIAIDTTIGNSAHASLGFDAVVRSGADVSFMCEVVNDLSADF